MRNNCFIICFHDINHLRPTFSLVVNKSIFIFSSLHRCQITLCHMQILDSRDVFCWCSLGDHLPVLFSRYSFQCHIKEVGWWRMSLFHSYVNLKRFVISVCFHADDPSWCISSELSYFYPTRLSLIALHKHWKHEIWPRQRLALKKKLSNL